MINIKCVSADATRNDRFDDVNTAFSKGWTGESHRNKKFNEKLYRLFDNRKISVLDIGCGGGDLSTIVWMTDNWLLVSMDNPNI